MRSTEKVSLSIDKAALLLARAAAAREGVTFSRYVSDLLLKAALTADPPTPATVADASGLEELDLQEEAYWNANGQHRAAG